jgi:hypothetical protein
MATTDWEYEIFEKFSDGSVMSWDVVRGLESARARLERLASLSKNEFLAVHTGTRDIAVRVNVPGKVRG